MKAWHSIHRNGQPHQFLARPRRTGEDLRTWNKEHFGTIQTNIGKEQHGSSDEDLFRLESEKVVRRRRNWISRVKDEMGNLYDSREEIKNAFIDKFQRLFSSENSSCLSHLEDLIHSVISQEKNEELSAIPSGEEIRKMVWNMDP
ncbi:hypothetical protein L484_002405 [Morus notabilis]|uniref:Uncharacterized protein n=1 Tax=Morus notabilis TaxID=981085 RepID=W9SF23_9ROSA|nr:hypothetical protein L484_002405 [Morus notabilis]